MSTGCEAYEQQLSLYLDDRLGPEERGAFAVHLKGCVECREAHAAHLQLRESLALRPEPEPSPFLKSHVMAEIAALEQAGSSNWLSEWLSALRIVAPLTSALAVCVLLWGLWQRPKASPKLATSAPISASERLIFGEPDLGTDAVDRALWNGD